MTDRLRALVLVALSFGVVSLFFNNCGLERPGASSEFSRTRVNHDLSKITSCSSCHEDKRPLAPAGAHLFVHSDPRFGGSGDCIQCHSEQAGVTWAKGSFSHAPMPSTCIECHINQRPTGIVGTSDPPFNHGLNGQGECVNCHSQSTRFKDLKDWLPGKINPTGLIGNRTFTINVVTPSFNGTVMTKSAPLPTKFTLEVLHTSALVGTDCMTCHKDIPSGNYATGQFHPNITANPTACLECHSRAEPVGLVGDKGFMRHEAKRWTANGVGNWTRSNNAVFAGDCAICHTDNMPLAGQPLSADPIYVPFSGASFHKSVTSASLTSCLDCHAADRPNSTSGWTHPTWASRSNVGTPPSTTFNLSTHAQNVDCTVCHAAPNSAGTSKANWANGIYSHNAITSANCLNCHDFPKGVQSDGVQSFDHAGSNTNCLNCHANASTGFPTPNMDHWKGGTATPSGVSGEKTVTTATTCIGRNANVPNCAPSNPNRIVVGMDHNAVPNLSQCSNCHGSGPPTALNGEFHKPPVGVSLGSWVAPNVPQCSLCHDPSTPPGSLARIRDLNMVGRQVNGGNGVDHGHASMTSLSCNTCHTAPTPNAASTWNGASNVHAKIAGASLNSCAECHYKKMPAGAFVRKVQPTYKGNTSGAQKFTHTNSLISATAQECSHCHTDKGGSWTSAGSTSLHKYLTVTNNCTLCHVAPTGTVTSSIGAGAFSHATIGTSDCAGCHQASFSKIAGRTPTVADWDGGVGMPHPATGSTVGSTENCASCHGPNGTATHRLSTSIANHYYQATSCIGCHSDFTQFGSNFLRYNHSAPVASGKCFECHNFNSGSYTSYTKIANFNIGSNFNLGANVSITGSFDGDSFNSTHASTKLQSCRDCHQYTQPTAPSTNVWRFQHRPTNYGVRYSRTQAATMAGCTACHEHQ